MALALAAGPAVAHKPLFVEPSAPAPLIEDGTISVAAYGRIRRPGDRHVVRVHLAAGQTLSLELLLPDQPPERSIRKARRPVLTIVGPHGRRQLRSDLGVRFDEATTGTSYVRIAESRRVSPGGVYRISVSGGVRSRFVIVVGERESFGVADLAALPANIARVRSWYRTP